jgi:acyl carrier protein
MMEKVVVQEKIKNLMATLFAVSPSQIDDRASQESLEKWDSLGHLNFVMALEEEFCIQLSDEQVIELLNYPMAVQTVFELLEKR